jgi:hypothetical protein
MYGKHKSILLDTQFNDSKESLNKLHKNFNEKSVMSSTHKIRDHEKI